jgi:hypothetical protein
VETRTYNGIGQLESVALAGGRRKAMLYDVWLGTPRYEYLYAPGGEAPWKAQEYRHWLQSQPR